MTTELTVYSKDSPRRVQNEIKICDRCLRDPEIGPQLRPFSFFLPLPSNVEEPPYTYLFVAMEYPENWPRTEAEDRREVNEGHVSFVKTMSALIWLFAIWEYILCEGNRFVSKRRT